MKMVNERTIAEFDDLEPGDEPIIKCRLAWSLTSL
jgi:hypothetical protein